jgi:hypothetical protein
MANIQSTANTSGAQDMGELEISSLLVGMQTRTATLEGNLSASYNTKHTLARQSSNFCNFFAFKQRS